MAIPIEGCSVVAKWSCIESLLEQNAVELPNGTSLHDEHIWKISFMAENDGISFLEKLEALGLNTTQGPDSDAVRVSEFDCSIEPFCEWLNIARWDKAVIVWFMGTNPDTVTAHKGWDPKKGSGLQFHDPSSMDNLEFLRIDGNVEAYRNKETGEEVYIGRTTPSPDALFKSAAAKIREHGMDMNTRLSEESKAAINQALGQLEQAMEQGTATWQTLWFYGKGHAALRQNEQAYKAFKQALELEKSSEPIYREFANVCLELRKFDEAVTIAEGAAALEPTNAMVLGNLAICYLMAQRLEASRKAIDAAIKLDPADQVNQNINRKLIELEEGRREAPKTLADLSKPAKPPRKKFLGLF